VITTKCSKKGNVNWGTDVQHENIHVHRISANYPMWLLSSSSKNILGRYFRKFLRFVLMKTMYYLDPAQRWGSKLIPCARAVIKEHHIKNVVVTGPPSSLHYTSAFLKIENPEIHLIQDYRDSWNDDVDYQYLKKLNYFWQKEKSVYMEIVSMIYSDVIVFPTNDILHRMKKTYGSFSKKFVCIHNGYDVDDYGCAIINPGLADFKMIYIGNIPDSRIPAFTLLCSALNKMQDEYFQNNFTVDIFGKDQDALYSVMRDSAVFSKYFHRYSETPLKQISANMPTYSFGLSINAEMYPYAFGTKVFDYMATRRKIFLISNGGELYELLKVKGHYVARYDVDDIIKTLKQMKEDYLSAKMPSCDFDNFDIPHLTQRYEELFL